MVLLPVAFGIAILALLVLVRRERHERETGLAARRPLLVRTTLAEFAVLAVLYLTVYLISALTA